MFSIIFDGFKNIILSASSINSVLLQNFNFLGIQFNIISFFGLSCLLAVLLFQFARWLIV